jgi:mannose-1-phosphate guanylyltransferase
MKGIIIAGGLGTRLRPLTNRRPKPLVPLANRPFLEYQVALLKQHGVDDVVFATNYMAEKIEAHFGDGSRFGVRMRYALEETPLGTGGAIRNAAALFPGESVVVFNGDILTDFDLSAVMSFHAANAAVATITLSPIPRPHPFGVLSLDKSGRVLAWDEPSEEAKRAVEVGPDNAYKTTDLINAGFYVLSPDAVSGIPAGTASSIERDIYPALIEGGRVYGHAPGGFWMDVGRPLQLMEATRALLERRVRTPLSLVTIGQGATVSPAASVDMRSAIGRECIVEDGASIEGSILMDGARIGRGARVRNAIVDEATSVPQDTSVECEDGAVVVLDNQGLYRF